MKQPQRFPIPELIRQIGTRLPGLTGRGLLELLSEIARSDGKLSSAEAAILREVARAKGLPEGEWSADVERPAAADSDAWSVLGIPPGSSPDVIKTAFRQKMSQCHPDRFAQHPKEFQDLATKQTIAIKQAYDFLAGRSA